MEVLLTYIFTLLLGLAIGALMFSSSPQRGLQELIALLVVLTLIGVALMVMFYILKFLLYFASYFYLAIAQ